MESNINKKIDDTVKFIRDTCYSIYKDSLNDKNKKGIESDTKILFDGVEVNNMEIFNFVQQGWQCPICKRILAPFVTECPCGGIGIQTYTTTSGTINKNNRGKNNE